MLFIAPPIPSIHPSHPSPSSTFNVALTTALKSVRFPDLVSVANPDDDGRRNEKGRQVENFEEERKEAKKERHEVEKFSERVVSNGFGLATQTSRGEINRQLSLTLQRVLDGETHKGSGIGRSSSALGRVFDVVVDASSVVRAFAPDIVPVEEASNDALASVVEEGERVATCSSSLLDWVDSLSAGGGAEEEESS